MTPLLLISLTALWVAQVRLPRGLIPVVCGTRENAGMFIPLPVTGGSCWCALDMLVDVPTREIALAALAFAIHSGNQGASSDTMSIDHGIDVVSQCLVERIGTSTTEARQSARSILTLGEEEIRCL